MPIGPYLVAGWSVGGITTLEVRSWVNGERRKIEHLDIVFGRTSGQLYRQYITLDPEIMIGTGTPEGVVLGGPRKIGWFRG
jgi:2-keto-4-pentenoate hydratase/2-oxohepta-3-ene-1,7-dioic acid hydratase in catechol pathway